MKKNLYYILYIGMLLVALVGCQDEDMFSPESDEVFAGINYTVKVDDGIQSRAIGDGTKVDQLVVGVFQEGKQIERHIYKVIDGKTDIHIPLLRTETYDLVFWAQTEGNGIYNTENLNHITVDYTDFNKTQAEGIALDAFYAVRKGITVNDPGNKEITLVRPFAQMSFGVYGNDVDTDKIASVEITVNGSLYTGFTPLAVGEKTMEGHADKYVFNFTELTDKTQTFLIDGKEYIHLTANYFFCPTTLQDAKISGSVKLKDEDGISVSEFDFTDAPLLYNTRVNIGKGLVEVWDGVIVEALPIPDGDGIIHIENTQQLAYLVKYGLKGSLKEMARVHLCKDLDMNLQPIERDGAYTLDSVAFDGGGHTIYRLGSALFRSAAHVEVTDLNIMGSDIVKEEGHVGALIDTLRSSAIFTGVTVDNVKVNTKSGSAGAMVGFIVRNSEKDRGKKLDVMFDDCHVFNSIPKGTETEGYFVGLFSGYDNGESLIFTKTCSLTVEEEIKKQTMAEDEAFSSCYVDANKAEWLSETKFTNYDGWLGSERYHRGIVRFEYEDEDNEGIQFNPRWDGRTSVEPLLANTTYDSNVTAGNNKFVVYSPFDLAGVRMKTASPAAIYLRADIDMNGQGADGKFNVPSNFAQSAHSSTDDNVFDPFNYVTTLDGKKNDTENYSIYNLSIAQIEQERAAFILYASGTTTHKNINFRNCQTVAVHKQVETDAKAYGAILVSNVDATYTMENVHAYDCKVFALQKVGTLGARISGTSTLKNNSVNNCYVENYECMINERFSSGKINKTISIPILGDAFVEEVWADFYPHGEVGGMYGFIQGKSTITGCNVNSTTIYAFGQNDKEATIVGNDLAKLGIAVLKYYLVPGRHVSTMIGNIRATGAVTLTNCKVDSNSKCTNRWDKHQWRVYKNWKYTYYTYDYIGQAYYVEFLDSKGSVTVDGTALTLGDCKDGTLYGTK